MLVLTEEQIRPLLRWDDLIPTMESALAAFSEGRVGALRGSLRHPVGGRDPQEGGDEDADNSFGRRGFGPRWADVAPAQARRGVAPVAR